jgi:hypothetical protein
MNRYVTDPVRASSALDWTRSSLGVLGLFASLGVGLLILAFSAAYALKGVNLNDPNQANAAAAAYLVGLLPLVAAPILAAIGGLWAGTRTRDAGDGALAGALGAALGVLLLGLLTALGFSLGASAANVDLSRIAWPAGFWLRPGWQATLADIGTRGGLLYLVASTLVGGLAGAITGALTRRHAWGAYSPRNAPSGYPRYRMPRI